MKTKTSPLKLRRYTKNDLKIEGQDLCTGAEWLSAICTTSIPFTANFRLDGLPDQEINEIHWNVNNKKIIVVEIDKHGIIPASCMHIYTKSPRSTLQIQASAFSIKSVFISPEFTITVPMMKNSKNYIDPTEFRDQIVDFYENGEMSDRLAEAVQTLATRLAFKPCFINYTYREEMIGDAIIKMIKALQEKKFDPKKGNPFSYFTKIAFHAFCNRIKKEKKEKDTVTAYQEDIFTTLVESGFTPHPKGNNQGEEGDSIETY